MGLTDEMTRLCGEIVALRQLRRVFVLDLAQNVSRLKASFRQARSQMSQETREKLASAVFDLKASVAGMRQENLLDLEGARRAWLGKPSPGQGGAGKRPPGATPPKDAASSRQAPAAATRPASPAAPRKTAPKKPSSQKKKPAGSAAGKRPSRQGGRRKPG